ncbi:unnamed protein product [Adineta ricciae]|uniref:G-protein coupled receptors family 1 profile domain-containing protein n=1 Tax=Adineta ricciae TaxID=249248 RepID=A0A814RXA0_ADIRI|nr:unnamed protein product [Adineta ricciae]CAF1362448.1 unnamed protein product [Adineta ricciae]
MLTDYPFALIYYSYRRVIPATPSFCLWWNWWVYSLSAALVWSTAWGSIERHLLIFHSNLVSTKRKQFYFHILPAFIVMLYPFIFYFVVIFCSPCENYWNYNYVFCLQPCFAYSMSAVALYDFVMHVLVPLTIITVSNVSLVARVLWQKRKRPRDWRRKWKLTTYLISITIFFVITWYPTAINTIVYMYTLSPLSIDLQVKYFFFLPVLLGISLPMISLFFLQDFKKTVFRFQRVTVNPQTFNRQTLAARGP